MGTTPVVVDATVVLAVVNDEPRAAESVSILSAELCRISTVTVSEIVDVGLRLGISRERVEDVVQELEQSLEVVPPGLETVVAAGALRSRWHERRGSRVSLADCMVVATARPGERVASADAALLRMARGEGLEVIALPGTRERGR